MLPHRQIIIRISSSECF